MPEDTIKRVDYTPITQALRAAMDSDGWANSTTYCVKLSADMDTFNALCDDIDALHKSLERKNAGMRDFCERVEQAAQAREDVDLWGVSYTALPLDADGVPIHVGDVMKGEKVGGGFGEPFEVVGYIMSNGELEPMDEHKLPRKRKYLHHYHAPTVEDVLREFAYGLGVPVADSYVAAAATKLRLAEGVDE